MSEVADFDVVYVDPETVVQNWGSLASWIDQSCDESLTPDEVYVMVRDSKAVLLVVRDSHDMGIVAICTVRAVRRPELSWLEVMTMTGEGMSDWLDTLNTSLVEYAKEQKLDGLAASVRPGLERPLHEMGWKRKQIRMIRGLDNG